MSLSREYSAPLLYIDGDWIGADARESEPVYNPGPRERCHGMLKLQNVRMAV